MMTLRDKLVHTVTEHDRRESSKPGYNRYALPQYLARIDEVIKDIEAGANVREAIIAGFNGRLCDKCLKAAGEATATREELNRGWGYTPAAKGGAQ